MEEGKGRGKYANKTQSQTIIKRCRGWKMTALSQSWNNGIINNGILSSFSLFTMMLAVCLSYVGFIMLKE